VNRFSFSSILLLLFSSRSSFAETVYLTPSADTALLEAFPANNFGGQIYFNSGTTQNNTKNRGLLKFDIAGQLPPNAKIKSASLTLEVTRAPSDGDNPNTFELRRMLRDWGEGNKSGEAPLLGAPASTNEANWTYRFAFTTNIWSVPGGQVGVDFSTNSSGEQYFYGPSYSPYTIGSNPQITADVQSWLIQPANNFGWMFMSQSEELNFTARRFGSREDTNRAPILEVTYFVPRIDQITLLNDSVELGFFSEAEQSYTVEYQDVPGSGLWMPLTNFLAATEAAYCVAQDSITNSQRFYRLMLP
jgi:hypothetical protein